MAITKIADIPFVERDALQLLALDHDRLAPDADYAGFGWATVDRVVLSAPDRPPLIVERPVIVALHSADDQPDASDVDLLFEVGDQSLVVALSKFMPHALARIPGDRPVVLALCNPGRVAIAPEGRVVHYAWGDVTSWLDRHGDAAQLRLAARRWLTSSPHSAATSPQPKDRP